MDGLRGIATINKLSLSSNQLENLDGLKGITSISILWLDNNPTLQISYLPPSLLYLLTNFSQLCNFDFKSVPKLRKLYSDSTDRSHFRNLPQFVNIEKLNYWNDSVDLNELILVWGDWMWGDIKVYFLRCLFELFELKSLYHFYLQLVI